jgi:hypothetical protein
MSRVAAFDLSLTGTGWCVAGEMAAIAANPEKFVIRWGTIDPKPLTGMARLQRIVNAIMAGAESYDLVIMEDLGPIGGMRGKDGTNARVQVGNSERIGLAYIVRYAIWLRNIRYVLVSPASLKKFTAGSGSAKKENMILEVYKRFVDHDGNAISCATSDEADAVGLCFIGRALLGEWEPYYKEQREVLAKLKGKS